MSYDNEIAVICWEIHKANSNGDNLKNAAFNKAFGMGWPCNNHRTNDFIESAFNEYDSYQTKESDHGQ